MKTTTRRTLLKAAAMGGVTAAGLTGFIGAEAASALGAEQKGKEEEHDHDHDEAEPLTGKRALAVVAFGQWDANPALPFDRQPVNTDLENRTRNVHKMLPFEVEIETGGAVSFMISGVHQILIYGPGRDLTDVKAGFANAGSPVLPVGPGLVNYDPDRVYRGMNPFALQYLPLSPSPAGTTGNQVVDRIEAVNFKAPGRYLVVCGVLPHFNEDMHGYVNVRA